MSTTPFRDPSIEGRLAGIEKRLDTAESMIIKNTSALRDEKFGKWTFRCIAVIAASGLLVVAGFGIYKGCESIEKSNSRHPSTEERRRTADVRTCEGVGMRYLTRNDETLLCGNGEGVVLSLRRKPGGLVEVTRSKP